MAALLDGQTQARSQMGVNVVCPGITHKKKIIEKKNHPVSPFEKLIRFQYFVMFFSALSYHYNKYFTPVAHTCTARLSIIIIDEL